MINDKEKKTATVTYMNEVRANLADKNGYVNTQMDEHQMYERTLEVETPPEDNYQRRFLIAASLSLSVIAACWYFMTP